MTVANEGVSFFLFIIIYIDMIDNTVLLAQITKLALSN